MKKERPIIIYIMGVSGTGKSTIGLKLSKIMGMPFFDGDDFHSLANKTKMKNGSPLTDEDRYNWLLAIHGHVAKQLQLNSCIVACSALKKQYRYLLAKNIEQHTKWIFLNGSFTKVLERLQNRKDHFMPTALLKSQFKTLEIPDNALNISIDNPPETIVEMIKTYLLKKSEIGIIGLGVMGKSLCRNFASKGIDISMYNRHLSGVEENVALNLKKKHSVLASSQAYDDLKSFVDSLNTPRKILLMVNAGKTTDIVLNQLTPLLEKNDIVIDCGNSHYADTERRIQSLNKKEVHFLGCGLSGGEAGALKGSSLMPGGNNNAYKKIKKYLETIAAKDKNGKPCCAYIGGGGSGHFIKMIHNGIEYAEMQLLAEVYHIYKKAGKTTVEIANLLNAWKGEVNSYLLEITIVILNTLENNEPLLDKILDKAKNKGTGNWATIASTELGIPSTLITSALFARYISTFKEKRIALSQFFRKDKHNVQMDNNTMLQAYRLARIINHYQGFSLLKEASDTMQYHLSLSEIARIWTNGCIIRSEFMETLVSVLKEGETMLFKQKIIAEIKRLKPSLTEIVVQSISYEIPIPCFSEALNFFNAITEKELPANLIQAQRDYFGAHTYQRNDKADDKFYHTNWKQ